MPWTSTFTFLNHTDHEVDRYKFAKHMELNIYMGLNGPQVWWFLWQARFKTLGFFGKYKRCGFSDRSFLFRCRTSFASPPQVKSLNTLFFVSVCTSKDHASVQLNIGHLDADGIYTGQFTTFALCDFVRAQVSHTLLSNRL